MELTVTVTEKKSVQYLRAECGVRYWDDATVNGESDERGTLIPCRHGQTWAPVINLETGKIADWPEGAMADVHFKVCDDGVYHLLDGDEKIVKTIDGYVPKMMAPGGDGYGDYVIMKIGPDGLIENWKADLSPFEDED